MKKLLLTIISAILFQQCNTTEPPIKVEKNPRTYDWTIDTLSYPSSLQTRMQSIWGSSPENMYVAGDCDDIRGQLWHYDGKQWASIYNAFGVAYTPYVVYGFSTNDIWVAGGSWAGTGTLDSAFVIHYDGSSWNRINAYGGKAITTIWGRSPKDIWFGGLNGTLFHWDGVTVKRDTLPIYIPLNADPFYQLSIYGKATDDETYFMITDLTFQTHTYLFVRKQNNWSVIDSSLWGYSRAKVWVSEKGNIYETGSGGFFRWNGNSWDNILGWFSGFTSGIEALSESENNMFIVGWDFPEVGKIRGLVFHYNGDNFYLYENLRLDDVRFIDVWWNGEEVFIVGSTFNFPQKSIILHGK